MKDVGLPVHVPLLAVSVWPTCVVPVIVGGAVLAGGAALAVSANAPAATAASSATSIRIVFLMFPPLASVVSKSVPGARSP